MDEEKLSYFLQYSSIIPEFDRFMDILKIPQPYWIRVNTLKIQEDKLIKRLEKKGFVFERFGNLNAYKILSMPVKHPGATIEHSLGYYYVQDLSSMAPVFAMNLRPGEVILDMAAAPGSKTTMMAEIMRNRGTIVANDVSLSRIKSLGGNIERLGITNVILLRKDARKDLFGVEFDKILLDAPCSGEGVIRKNPWNFHPANEREHRYLREQQIRMLKNAVKHLKEGGIIVYSTCTFHPLENESVVEYGINKLNLEPVEFDIPISNLKGVDEWMGESYEHYKYFKRIYPHLVDTGGMFIAVLKK